MKLVINGQTVDEDVFYEEFENIKQNYENQTGQFTCCDHDDEFMDLAKENLITRTLLNQQAMKTIEPIGPDEVEQAFQDMAEQHGGKDKFFEAYNLIEDDEDKVRQDLAQSLLVKKLLEGELGPLPTPSEDELRAFYEENIETYMLPPKARASHILKSLTHGEDRAEAFKTICELRDRVVAGEDIQTLAKEHSDNPENDGDLGLFGRGELVEEFEAVVFSSKPGEVSPVVMSPFGYHVIKVTERVEPAPKPFDEVKEEVDLAYRQQKDDDRVRAYVKQLQAKSTIEELPDDDADESYGESAEGGEEAGDQAEPSEQAESSEQARESSEQQA